MFTAIIELGFEVSLRINCPKCKGVDVVVEIIENYYKVYNCNICGFVNNNLNN